MMMATIEEDFLLFLRFWKREDTRSGSVPQRETEVPFLIR